MFKKNYSYCNNIIYIRRSCTYENTIIFFKDQIINQNIDTCFMYYTEKIKWDLFYRLNNTSNLTIKQLILKKCN